MLLIFLWNGNANNYCDLTNQMNKIAVDAFNIITPLGSGVETNFNEMLKGTSAVQKHHLLSIDDNPLWAALVEDKELDYGGHEFLTHYEKMLFHSISEAQKLSTVNLDSEETIFIFSTTKGNISLIETEPLNDELIKRVSLSYSASLITSLFGNKNTPVVISNACISGVVALLYARRLLINGKYKNAVVTGADTISKFVYSGFQSFQALSAGHCRPFSSTRDGINLGEAGATIILTASSAESPSQTGIFIEEGGISNDSNHISGPSRTGAELSEVIDQAINLSGITAGDIGFISAHGTATPFNDEMEAKAFHLSGMGETPVNSMKGYFGHTLGA